MPAIKRDFFILLICCLYASEAKAQCSSVINTFPYNMYFASSDGNWIPGGTASDWAWGPTTKFGGTGTGNAWMTGGLVNHFYNAGENSWLRSPCFDFTALIHPFIFPQIGWDTEKDFDGASLQYSLDGGINWITLGTGTESSCTAQNWYNNSAVTFLGSPGWSGNNQPTVGSCRGGGACPGGGVTAKYDLTILAGQPTVMFRFRFASGSTCNNYDGFCVGGVIISEVLPATGTEDFTYSCSSDYQVNFTSITQACATGYQWDFGDPASGLNNTSTAANPSHIFSAPAGYTVTEKFFYATMPTVTVTHIIPVFSVKIDTLSLVKCFGDHNGSLTAVVNGPAILYNYIWYTTPPQNTPTISGLGAGIYSVNVSSNSSCGFNTTAFLTEPPALKATVQTTNAFCGSGSGTATVNPSDGTGPYSYLWSNNANTATATSLTPGTYAVDVTDANSCKLSKTGIVISNINKPVPVFLGKDTIVCSGQTVLLNPGNFAAYLWQDNSTGPTFLVNSSGKYSVKVTDANGCFGADTINVTADCSDIHFPNAFTPDHNSLNDRFGPLGNISAVSNYSLKIYGRWSELIFSSTNPAERWDGTIKGKSYNSGSFLWIATYSFNGKPVQTKNGTVLLIK